MKFIFYILALLLLFIGSIADCQSPSDLEDKLRDMGIDVPSDMDLNQLMEKYREVIPDLDKALIDAGTMTDIPIVSSRQAATPEEEVERQKKIINFNYHQSKNKLSILEKGDENPQIAEAITVEGYIAVHGGERKLWYSNEIESEMTYSIRENFVGNLIILQTYNVQTRKFEKEKDYMLHTFSTKINLQNMAGKQCVKWSYISPKTCVNYVNFLNYEIDKGEIYPNFYSGVVSIPTSEKGKVILEASTPNIIFSGKRGIDEISTTVKCTGGTWSLTKEDMEKFLARGDLTLRQEIGSPSQGNQACVKGSNITLYLKIKKEEKDKCKRAKKVKIQIVKPADKSKYIFTGDEPTGRLILELEAKTSPAGYENSIEWEIPELEGSQRIIQSAFHPSTPKGARVEVLYKGLPLYVDSFGRKKFVAKVNVDGCVVEDAKEIMLFYPRDAKNNPEGKYPNWFYYWKQTPAAKPFGQNVNLEFGGTEFDLCKGEHVMAIYKPDYLYKSVHICNLTEKVGGNFEITIPLVSRRDSSTLSQKKLVSYTHIDTFAVLVMHEFTHFNHYHTWWFGKPVDYRGRMDKDGDGIPDHLEEGMGFNPNKFQTYWGEDEEFKNINGDEEFLAYESTYDYPAGKYDEYDWGKPGKNWK